MNSGQAKMLIGRKFFGFKAFVEPILSGPDSCGICPVCKEPVRIHDSCLIQSIQPQTTETCCFDFLRTIFWSVFHRTCRDSIKEDEAATMIGELALIAWPGYLLEVHE